MIKKMICGFVFAVVFAVSSIANAQCMERMEAQMEMTSAQSQFATATNEKSLMTSQYDASEAQLLSLPPAREDWDEAERDIYYDYLVSASEYVTSGIDAQYEGLSAMTSGTDSYAAGITAWMAGNYSGAYAYFEEAWDSYMTANTNFTTAESAYIEAGTCYTFALNYWTDNP